jgi:hypothetical protein
VLLQVGGQLDKPTIAPKWNVKNREKSNSIQQKVKIRKFGALYGDLMHDYL